MRIQRPNLERLIDDAVGSLRKRRSDLRRRNAMLLRRLILDDFEQLSRGGRGADGRRWKIIRPVTSERKGSRLIGVDTGSMRASLVVRSTGDLSWEASFGSPHAGFFDSVRPLLPDGTPDAWDRALSESIVRWGDEVLREVVR